MYFVLDYLGLPFYLQMVLLTSKGVRERIINYLVLLSFSYLYVFCCNFMMVG